MKRSVIFLVSIILCVTAQAQELKPFVRGSQQAIMALHQGKPFILSLWSLDCTHCIDDMAQFSKLVKKYHHLDLVLVSTDVPEQKQQIVRVLHHYHLEHVESWVFADDYVERLRFEIDPTWRGELPRTYFFDAAGHSTAISGTINGDLVEHQISAAHKRK